MTTTTDPTSKRLCDACREREAVVEYGFHEPTEWYCLECHPDPDLDAPERG